MNGSRWENMIKAASDGKCCLRCCSSVLFRKILLLKVKRFKTGTHASTATALNAARRGAYCIILQSQSDSQDDWKDWKKYIFRGGRLLLCDCGAPLALRHS